MKWKIVIYPSVGSGREIYLDHEYETEQEAEREAENIADQEFQELDETWTLEVQSPCPDCGGKGWFWDSTGAFTFRRLCGLCRKD